MVFPTFILAGFLLVVGLGNSVLAQQGKRSRGALDVPATQRISPQIFAQAILKSLKQQFSRQDVELSVEVVAPSGSIEIPSGQVDLQVPPDTMNGRTGRRAYRVAVRIDQQLDRMVNVMANVEARLQGVTPVRVIRAREAIQPKDVRVTNFFLQNLTDDVFSHAEAVIGMTAKRLLLPNKPIRRTAVALPPVIKKGDRVVIEARQGGLLVQTIGIAKAAGAAGMMIAVENQQSKREIIGKVLEAGLVEVLF